MEKKRVLMTMARSLPASLAPLVEELELDQPRLVTTADLASIIARTQNRPADHEDARKLAYRLQEHGWLGRLRTRDVWEFLPGARAGTYGSGDRLIELRAQLATKPQLPIALAMESAATLLGYAQRPPSREVVSCPPGHPLPKALSDWRVIRMTFTDEAVETRDALPVWGLEALIAGIATRPSSYEDRPGLAQWLPDAGSQVNIDKLRRVLHDAKLSTWQRSIHLLNLADRPDLATALATERPPRTPVWFGAHRAGGTYDPTARVTDADLAPFMDASGKQ